MNSTGNSHCSVKTQLPRVEGLCLHEEETHKEQQRKGRQAWGRVAPSSDQSSVRPAAS